MRLSTALGLVAIVSLVASEAVAKKTRDPEKLVAFSDPSSILRFERSKHKIDFFTLANQFEGQITAGHCGPATAVIIMNALFLDDAKVEKPKDKSGVPENLRGMIPPQFDPYLARFTQLTFFDAATERAKPMAQFFGKPKAAGDKPDPGFQLRQIHQALLEHGVQSTIRVVDDKQPEVAVKKEIVENLGRAGDYVVVNYFRPVLGQKGGGHISPLGAYDEESDSFLILDVNSTAKRWVWVPASLLVAAMRTFDRVENRGYLLVAHRAPK